MKATRILAVACLLMGWHAGWLAGPSQADTQAAPASGNPAATGYDISWPQCGTGLPESPAYSIVGVNGGRPHTANPCFAEQLAWADRSAEAAAALPSAVYVNTAATGPVGSVWWPAANTAGGAAIANPYGTCDGSASAACAYIHGYTMAANDAAMVADAGGTARRMYWLDVETGNSWLPDKAANTAELEGMTAFLQSAGIEVGIYSTGFQFAQIVGQVGPASNLYPLKSWLAGAESGPAAEQLCSAAPLTAGGVVALAQFTDGILDYNVRCPAGAPAPAPTSAPAPAPTPAPQETTAPGKLRPAVSAKMSAAQIA